MFLLDFHWKNNFFPHVCSNHYTILSSPVNINKCECDPVGVYVSCMRARMFQKLRLFVLFCWVTMGGRESFPVGLTEMTASNVTSNTCWEWYCGLPKCSFSSWKSIHVSCLPFCAIRTNMDAQPCCISAYCNMLSAT